MEYARRITARSKEHAREHPELSRYIYARNAEVEFCERAASSTVLLGATNFELYQRALLGAAYKGSAVPSEAQVAAESSLRQVLGAIAAVVAGVLDPKGGKDSTIEANLMLPCALDALPPKLGTNAETIAEWLWRGVPSGVHKRLIVVAETEGARHKGFWIPDVRPKGVCLPGAPTALSRGTCEAIFVDDLPSFPIDDAEMAARWQRYLAGGEPGHFAGDMFFSIPVLSRVGLDHRLPMAVVNVNVKSEQPWFRGYSGSWRRHLLEQLAPWLALCCHSAVLAVVAGERAGTLSAPWPSSSELTNTGQVINLLSGETGPSRLLVDSEKSGEGHGNGEE